VKPAYNQFTSQLASQLVANQNKKPPETANQTAKPGGFLLP
jgi:hypothetical protein